MRQFFMIVVFAVLLWGCGSDDSDVTPDSTISLDDETFTFFGDGVVSDIRQNMDGSYRLGVTIYFGDSSAVSVTLNAMNDRFIETGTYRWSDDTELLTINSFIITSDGVATPLSFTSGTFIVERNDDLYTFNFDLNGEIKITGSYVGNLNFPERSEAGEGTFVIDGTSYSIPYFTLNDLIQVEDGLWAIQLYFYRVDPLDPYIRNEQTHSAFLTILQNSSEALIEGTFTFSDQVTSGSLLDGGPIIGESYELVGGSVSVTKDGENYDVAFSLEVSTNAEVTTVEGSYSGPLNGW